jgi:hypothetical protein
LSSSRPISSKFVTSDSKPSGLEKVEDNEEDFDDREPERSGGEPGTLVMVVVIFRRCASEREVNGRGSSCWLDVGLRHKSLTWVVLWLRSEQMLGGSAVQGGNAISEQRTVRS